MSDERVKRQALDGKRLNAFAMDPADLTIIGLDTKDGPEHPLYDERIHLPIDEAMVANIRAFGVIEPITVRKNGPAVEVVAGRQRVRHARLASERNVAEGLGPILVPCQSPMKATDIHAFGVMVSENTFRRDDDPMTRAKKASRMMALGATEADVAKTFGISKAQVRNLLSLLDLAPKVQKAVEAEKVPFTAAIQLADLPREAQVAKLDEMIASGAVSVGEAKRQRQARAAGADAEPRTKRPGLSTLRKVAEHEEFTASLSDDAKALLQWVIGNESAANRVKGLTAALKAIGAALVLLVGFGCSTSSPVCPTVDAGIVEGDSAVPVVPSLTHAVCWADGAGFQNCERVTCRDPFDGRLLVDQANMLLEPRCGDDGVPSCWGVLGPDPTVRELIAEGVEFVWCEVRP